jgi:uncharacterized protein YuzE
MKLSDSDDPYKPTLESSDVGTAGAREPGDNPLVDIDAKGPLCAITVEQASGRTDLTQVTLEGLAA